MRRSVSGAPAGDALDPQMGYHLAAAGPIDLALMLRTSPRGARVLSSAIGSSGEAVMLACHVGTGA